MAIEILGAVLSAVHVGAGAAWLGAMLYSLLVVQPRAERFFAGADRYEEFAVVLAAGARRSVLALCSALALSGAGLVATEFAARGPASPWVVLMVAKAALLAVAVGLFAHVSWRLWPARVFARPADLPPLQRRFRRVALALTAVVGAGLVLGAVADSLR